MYSVNHKHRNKPKIIGFKKLFPSYPLCAMILQMSVSLLVNDYNHGIHVASIERNE